LLVLDYILLYPTLYGTYFFGKITIALYWFLQISFLGGPRLAYRLFRHSRTQQHARRSDAVPTLLVGVAADAEVLIRAIESGAVKKVRPVAILSPSPADQGQSLRGVPVRGRPEHLERVVAAFASQDVAIGRLVLTPSALAPELHPETLLMQARRLGLTTSRLPSLEAGEEALRLAPVAVEDLLLRPSVKIDYQRLEDFVRGKTVVVTGGGGSIGSEICDRVVNFSAGRLLVIENSEPALHAVLEKLAAKSSSTLVEGRIADIRDRDRIFGLIAQSKPNLVFHAAALKHVPILERDWDEGIKTNVFGSVNVADAALNAGADAMVMISTDKAIDPVSVLGATKRLAEMYCQALDAGKGGGHKNGGKPPMRMIAVRFGNVLASNGSVVPKFKAQIEAGGPVTVTDPNMVRYFMTIREACDLVVTAASHALGPTRSDTSVYVLNMGQPIKIVDLAERLIRLSGLEPGRDVDIVFTGIRPGERLNEILFARDEGSSDIGIDGVVAAKPVCPSIEVVRGWIEKLKADLDTGERSAIYGVLQEAVPNFCGEVRPVKQ
jgi:FlaA1/EpsC-like NDP-sugar epimerase